MSEHRFFDDHQWKTIDAATSRIIPTDHDPGAREAGVVGFIDRYLSGIDYVYANPYGSGFLRLEGERAEVWSRRITMLQERYRTGIIRLDEVARRQFASDFADLSEGQQDDVLVEISQYASKPAPFVQGAPADVDARTNGTAHGQLGVSVEAETTGGKAIVLSQPVTDDELDFFDTLVLHTRQGFYADPVYGGNKDRIGWTVIGFPGPASMAETLDGRFSTLQYTEPGDNFYEVVAPELIRSTDGKY